MKNNLVRLIASDDFPYRIPEDRCTGRTTGLALSYISEAMLNPNKAVLVKDHHNSLAADRECLKTAAYLCQKMELKFFEFSPRRRTITFRLYNEEG